MIISKGKWNKFVYRTRIFVRDYTHVISGALLALGLVLLTIGVFAYWGEDIAPEQSKEFFGNVHKTNYDICIMPLGAFISIIAGWYLGDNLLKRREFNKLIKTTSKEKFIKNQDRIEELAWLLSTKHERMVDEKKKELKIRR